MIRKISFAAATLTFMAALGACVPRVEPPAPAPSPTPAPAPAPAPPAPPSVPTPSFDNWMDAPQTPGDWFLSSSTGSTTASFGPPESEAVFGLTCDRGSDRITLIQEGEAAGPVPMIIRTETTDRTLTARPMGTELPALSVTLDPRDPILDAMAFSKGRFAVQTQGQAALYIPAWPEITRVIEDCR